MKRQLTLERAKQILSYNRETGEFIRIKTNSYKIKPGSKAGGINTIGYVQIGIDGKIYLAHRIAWLFEYGEWPEFEIDHANGLRSDNRIINLREAKHHENICNRPKQINNTSGYKNVSWSKTMDQWMVRINFNKKSIIVGYFKDINDAINASFEARKKYHGEFSIDKRAA